MSNAIAPHSGAGDIQLKSANESNLTIVKTRDMNGVSEMNTGEGGNHFKNDLNKTLDPDIGGDDEGSNSEEEREALYGNDASNHLSYTKMMKEMDKIHPRVKIVDPETGDITYKPHSICKTNTGFPDCCSRKRRKSDLE